MAENELVGRALSEIIYWYVDMHRVHRGRLFRTMLADIKHVVVGWRGSHTKNLYTIKGTISKIL